MVSNKGVKGPVRIKKSLAMGKGLKSAEAQVKLKKGGVVKGKEVAVKHVALKKGGMAKKSKGC